MNIRLALAFIVTILSMWITTQATAQTVPLILLTPDAVTGEVTFRANTNVDDARVVETCVYRVDANSPDPSTPVACALVTSGIPPEPHEQTPSEEGVVVSIVATIPILPEDQTFGLRNVRAIEGQPIQSELSANSAVLPFAIVAPLFIVQGSN